MTLDAHDDRQDRRRDTEPERDRRARVDNPPRCPRPVLLRRRIEVGNDAGEDAIGVLRGRRRREPAFHKVREVVVALRHQTALPSAGRASASTAERSARIA